MTFDPTKPVQTRSGLKVEILRSNVDNKKFPIVALVTIDGRQVAHTFGADGRWGVPYASNPMDLVNVPEKHVRWVNLMRWDSGLQFVTVHGSAQLAKDYLV